MATNKIYVDPGAIFAFAASGVTVTGATSTGLWTPTGIAAGAGRISAVLDRGAGAHPMRYGWRMRTKWAASGTAGDPLRLYLVLSDASADPTQTDGGFTFGDAGLASEVALYQSALYLGAVLAGGTSAAAESASGCCQIYSRYVAVAAWNAAAAKALSSTAGDHIFTLTELPDEVEAAS
jgi:hypothetical protein